MFITHENPKQVYKLNMKHCKISKTENNTINLNNMIHNTILSDCNM